MTKEELIKKYIDKFKAIEKYHRDEEVAHTYADGILTDLLDELGYEEITALWEKVPKWYC